MSGIYIRDMEMPKCCAECFCMEQEDLFCRITERTVGGTPSLYSWNPRPDNCPLIPVPEHGRLGDLDALPVSTTVPFKWNPVEEGLPKKGGFYFTAFANGDVRENEFITFENEEPKWYFNETERGGVTHWMYLPSHPKKGTE